jgi:hypothetical protein
MGRYLKARGFQQLTSPRIGAVAVMQPGFADRPEGHVAVITAVDASSGGYWKISTRGANQIPLGLEREFNCINVNTVTWEAYPQSWGADYITYWYRPNTVFSTGWEHNQSQGNENLVIYSQNFTGYNNGYFPFPEAGPVTFESWATPRVFRGAHYLRVTGTSLDTYAYVYFLLFDTNIKIQNGMKLSYYIYTYQGNTFAMDGQFTDGNTIRDLYNNGYLTDQNGVRIHPAYQGVYRTGYWRHVEVDLSKASGKTLDYIMVAFDNGNNGFTGDVRAYLDNLSITNAP